MLEFDTIEDFNAWHDTVNAHFGYPNDSGTLQYTAPVTGTNGKIYAPYNAALPVECLGVVVNNPPLLIYEE